MAAERQALVQQVIKEVDTLSEVMLDRIMQNVAVEREATVNQLVDRLADERRNTIEEFLSEEKRIGGLLTNLRQTLATGNDVLTSTNTPVERLNLGPSEESTLPSSEPFDIRDYQATLVEASNVILQLHGLVRTIDQMGLEKSLPQIIKAIEQVETKGEEWVTHTAILGIMLISIFLVGGVFAMLAYRYFSQRILEKNQQRSVSGKGYDGPSLHAAKEVHH